MFISANNVSKTNVYAKNVKPKGTRNGILLRDLANNVTKPKRFVTAFFPLAGLQTANHDRRHSWNAFPKGSPRHISCLFQILHII